MNNDRHKRLNEVKERITAIICAIEKIRNEEKADYDNLPGSLKESIRGDLMLVRVEDLQHLLFTLEYAANEIEGIIE